MHSSSQLLLTHLRTHHGFYPSSKFRLICAQGSCRRQFSTFSGFRKHLNTSHQNDFSSTETITSLAEPNDHSSSPSFPFSDIDAGPCPLISDTNDCHSHNESGVSVIDTKTICASIIAKLQSSGVSNSIVSNIVGEMEEFAAGIHSQVKQDVLLALPADDQVRVAVEHSLNKFENPVTNFNTDTKRITYFSKKWGVIEPKEITLGLRYDTRRNKQTGTYDQVPVKDTFVYVPILETLKFICRNADIYSLLNTVNAPNTDLFENFCDGSYFKTHPLYSKHQNAFQIQLYYDDFETANPLGSKKSVHKIGALYFVLRNLPPRINSALMNIHLVALFHAQDLKKYGFDPILQPLIDDVKILENDGLDLPISTDQVYGTVCQVTGDNLGMHSILGFTESFSGRYFCRLCLIEKDNAQCVFSEDDPKVTLRCKEIFELHCKELSTLTHGSSVFGLKRNCTLNSLKFFHVCNNFAFDIMHDVLEGVAQYEMKLIFEHLTEKYLSKHELLSRIYAFDYGYLERKNRPTKINLEHNGNSIGLNSIQTLCLVRNLPLIFGDVVPEENQNWHLLLLLLQIINIVFSPSVTQGMTVYLKYLIAEHHELFKQLYPRRNLIPKHHYMIHYPASIRKIGPLLHMWSMRFEAKHRVFKNMMKNFKNITKSFAKKHQIAIACHWETSALNNSEYGPIKAINLCDIDSGEILAQFLNVSMHKDIFSTNWVKINGIEYRQGLVICSSIKDDMPVFSKITKILLVDCVIFFAVMKLHIDSFSEHFHAYKVFDGEEKDFIKADCLEFNKPFDLQSAYGIDEGKYIVPLFSLV